MTEVVLFPIVLLMRILCGIGWSCQAMLDWTVRSAGPHTSKTSQIEDGVAHDLAGAVEGDVAAAVAFEEFDAALGEEFRARNYICGFGIAAQGDDRLMLQQKKNIADLFFFAERDELLLQF